MTSKPLFLTISCLLLCLTGFIQPVIGEEKNPVAGEEAAGEKESPPEAEAKPENSETQENDGEVSDEDDQSVNTKDNELAEAAVARPVSADPVQIYGWREWITITDDKDQMKLQAKLDSGARTSSIHAEDKELFERDGKKWVRFVVTDPGEKDFARMRIEAPLVRIARIKEPAGESEAREVVRLSFTIGDRKLKEDFTLNNRVNMLSPVLIGRTTLKELGWIDPSRAYLAEKKLMR